MKVIGRYKLLEDFDAYICNVGRVQVGVGAEFELQKDSYGTHCVYFLNSKNYLPFPAVSTFLKMKREPLVNAEKEIENEDIEL